MPLQLFWVKRTRAKNPSNTRIILALAAAPSAMRKIEEDTDYGFD
jgi:hypothetical protein